MRTQRLSGSDPADIARAAELLQRGGLVAVPTETVYGLAANALNVQAVRRIFAAKGRPQDNPLIVHVAKQEQLTELAEMTPRALRLAQAFWPGPLTLVLPRKSVVPDEVSGGLDTVAVRMPAHPVMREVIVQSGVPLAAPSANRSGGPSPTTAAHVLADLDGKIDAVLDGGACALGVESTVVDVSAEQPVLLRPGSITEEQLTEVLGPIKTARAVLEPPEQGARVASPGMKYQHYAPKTQLVLIRSDLAAFAAFVNARAGQSVGALCFSGEEEALAVPALSYGSVDDALEQARALFGALRGLDALGCKVVYARSPQETGVGLAVYNRLLRAAGFEVLELA